MTEQLLWVEKYRPRKIADCILPETIKGTFQEYVNRKEIPNLLLAGSAGVGKTTVAKALCEEVGCDYIVINGSDEGRLIETFRNKIKNYASSVSLSGGRKVVIIDEADYTNADSVQPALRNFMEEFSVNCSFILTCNFKNRIIAPLQSRCSVIDFKLQNGQKAKMATQLFKRIEHILEKENVKYKKDIVASVITKYFPDNRRVLNELQRYASNANSSIDEGILVSLSDANISALIQCLKEKNFSEARKWLVNNIDNDINAIMKSLYDNTYTNLKADSIPQAVLILAKYQYQSAFVADQEINMMACLTELMVECEFK
jgi:DNA polymerase III delta prime subunit